MPADSNQLPTSPSFRPCFDAIHPFDLIPTRAERWFESSSSQNPHPADDRQVVASVPHAPLYHIDVLLREHVNKLLPLVGVHLHPLGDTLPRVWVGIVQAHAVGKEVPIDLRYLPVRQHVVQHVKHPRAAPRAVGFQPALPPLPVAKIASGFNRPAPAGRNRTWRSEVTQGMGRGFAL
jgi:hypothetical protein